jgi:hypothetical protein
MHTMMMHVAMHVVMHVHHRRGFHWRGSRRSAGYCVLRQGITCEANRKSGRDNKALDHLGMYPCSRDPLSRL